MDQTIHIGDQVEIFLDSKFGQNEGWHKGTVVRIDPYSEHRNFYWVHLDAEAQSILKVRELSVFNPKNIRKMDQKIP